MKVFVRVRRWLLDVLCNLLMCLQAGSAEGCHRKRPGAGEAGPAGEDRAEVGAGQREGAEGDTGASAEHRTEKQR